MLLTSGLGGAGRRSSSGGVTSMSRAPGSQPVGLSSSGTRTGSASAIPSTSAGAGGESRGTTISPSGTRSSSLSFSNKIASSSSAISRSRSRRLTSGSSCSPSIRSIRMGSASWIVMASGGSTVTRILSGGTGESPASLLLSKFPQPCSQAKAWTLKSR